MRVARWQAPGRAPGGGGLIRLTNSADTGTLARHGGHVGLDKGRHGGHVGLDFRFQTLYFVLCDKNPAAEDMIIATSMRLSQLLKR